MSFQIVDKFYDAAWDLSERITLLPHTLFSNNDDDVTPESIISPFMDAAEPFLALTGDDIPQPLWIHYHNADLVMNEEGGNKSSSRNFRSYNVKWLQSCPHRNEQHYKLS